MNENKDLTNEETFALAVQNHQDNNLKIAENLYNAVLKNDPNYAAAYNNLGVIFQSLEYFDKAIINYKKAITINPNQLDALNNIGLSFHQLRAYEKAVSYFERVIKINPNHIEALNNLGLTYYDMLEKKKAIKYYEKVIKIEPTYTNAYHNLAIILKEFGQYKKAKNYFEKVIKTGFPSKKTLVQYGRTLLNINRDLKGLEYIAKGEGVIKFTQTVFKII